MPRFGSYDRRQPARSTTQATEKAG